MKCSLDGSDNCPVCTSWNHRLFVREAAKEVINMAKKGMPKPPKPQKAPPVKKKGGY